jgi:hypothetical protein
MILSQKDFKIVFLLTLLGMASSIFSLLIPIQGDEAASFLADWSYPFSNLIFHYSDITNHKLFTALSRISMALFGEHESTFRLPVFLAGALSIPLIYFLTLLILANRQTALISSFLLLFSYPRFFYSINGRGYIFSIFLAIALSIILIKLLEPRPKNYWKALWIIGGFGLVFTLPSNLVFLCGLGAYFLLENLYKKPSKKSFIDDTWPLWGLFAIIAVYFGIIYEDLQRGVLSYTNYSNLHLKLTDLKISFSRLGQTFEYLSQPWGSFFYFFPLLGFIFSRKNIHWFSLYLCLFILPVVFILFSGVMGPPRTFVFWIPFIMILASSSIYKIGQFIPHKSRIILASIFFLALGTISINKAKIDIDHNLGLPDTRISEAKEALDYLLSETSPHDLILFPFSDRVLRHYIEKLSSKRMLNIIKEGRLNRIITIGKKNMTPNQILSIEGFNKKLWWEFPWDEKYFNIEKNIDSLRVHSLKLKVADYESKNLDSNDKNSIGLKSNSLFTVGFSESSNLLGKKSLILKRKMDRDILAISNKPKTLDIKTQDNFLLYVYARKYKQKSRSMQSKTQGAIPFWLKGNNSIAKYFQIAPLYGIFSIGKEEPQPEIIHPHWIYLQPDQKMKQYWKIEFRLSAIEPGNYKVKEIYELKEDEAYFSGMKTFLIHR